jgi:hypothetical protein
LSTTKHIKSGQSEANTTSNVAIVAKPVGEEKMYYCLCGKAYKHRTSVYNHKKKCTLNGETPKLSQELILKLIEENSEIKNMLFKQFEAMNEQQKQMQNQISELIPKVGNNNTIINKQKFNINVFLNEKCKGALTMNEFIDKLSITLEDLFVTKNKGISEGVSNIFIKNMNKLSLYERPMHCTDVKRETVYIKSEAQDSEESIWIKDIEKGKFKKAISEIKFLQSKNLTLYTDHNPDWMEVSNKQTEYIIMMKNCMDDLKDNIKLDKVIKKVCNNVYLAGEK